MPLLVGTDGERKMAKSVGNYIGVTEPPDEIYGKTLSIPDAALTAWYELLLGTEPPPELGPRDAKRALARALVARFHGAAAAHEAEREFDRVHIERQAPEEMATVTWPAEQPDVHLPALLATAFGISTSEARRALAQGGVKLDGQPVGDGVARRAGARRRRQGLAARQAAVRARARGMSGLRSRAVWPGGSRR